MTVDLSKVTVFIRPGVTDLRKATNGLNSIIQEEMGQSPLDGNVYLFCSRNRKLLKGVYWDKTGFWLCQKRLEKSTWPWPCNEKAVMELSGEEVTMLLSGIDFFRAHKELHYSRTA